MASATFCCSVVGYTVPHPVQFPQTQMLHLYKGTTLKTLRLVYGRGQLRRSLTAEQKHICFFSRDILWLSSVYYCIIFYVTFRPQRPRQSVVLKRWCPEIRYSKTLSDVSFVLLQFILSTFHSISADINVHVTKRMKKYKIFWRRKQTDKTEKQFVFNIHQLVYNNTNLSAEPTFLL